MAYSKKKKRCKHENVRKIKNDRMGKKNVKKECLRRDDLYVGRPTK